MSPLGEIPLPARDICFPVAGCSPPQTDGRPVGGTRRGTGAASDPLPQPRPGPAAGSRRWARP